MMPAEQLKKILLLINPDYKMASGGEHLIDVAWVVQQFISSTNMKTMELTKKLARAEAEVERLERELKRISTHNETSE